MKPLLLLAIVVIVIPSPAAESHSAQTPPSSTSKQSKTKEVQPSQPPVTQQTTVNCQPAAQESTPQKKAPAKPSDGFIERLNAFSTLVIAIFAVVTAIAIFIQALIARNAARAWVHWCDDIGNASSDASFDDCNGCNGSLTLDSKLTALPTTEA